MICGDLGSVTKQDHKLKHKGRAQGEFPSKTLPTHNEVASPKLQCALKFNDDQTICKLNTYVHGFTLKIEFLFLQEHKFKGDKAKQLGKLLWKDALRWTVDVTLGYSIYDPNLRVGKEGELLCSKKVEKVSHLNMHSHDKLLSLDKDQQIKRW